MSVLESTSPIFPVSVFFSLADAVRILSSEYGYEFFLYKLFLLYFVNLLRGGFNAKRLQNLHAVLLAINR